MMTDSGNSDMIRALQAAQVNLVQAKMAWHMAQARRDALIAQAHDAGATWQQLRTATGLSNQGLAKALKRMPNFEPVPQPGD
jgi:hypothetical protein